MPTSRQRPGSGQTGLLGRSQAGQFERKEENEADSAGQRRWQTSASIGPIREGEIVGSRWFLACLSHRPSKTWWFWKARGKSKKGHDWRPSVRRQNKAFWKTPLSGSPVPKLFRNWPRPAAETSPGQKKLRRWRIIRQKEIGFNFPEPDLRDGTSPQRDKVLNDSVLYHSVPGLAG